MSASIPNIDPVGNDCCLTPIVVEVPFVLVEHPDSDCFWYPEVMDEAAAGRMAFGMMRSLSVEAYRVGVKVILPAASDIRAVTADLDRLKSDPVRASLIAR